MKAKDINKQHEKNTTRHLFIDAVNEHLRNGWIVVDVSFEEDKLNNQTYWVEKGQVVTLVKEIWVD